MDPNTTLNSLNGGNFDFWDGFTPQPQQNVQQPEDVCVPVEAPLPEPSLQDLLDLPCDLKVSLKEFAVIAADSYISNSRLEGISVLQTLQHAIKFKKFMPNHAITDILQLIKDETGVKKIGEFSEVLAARVKKEGRALFFGGYRGTQQGDPGHALLFEVDTIRQNLRIYNQGDGIKYHMKGMHGRKQRNGAYYEKQDIPLWILQSPFFYISLLSPNCCSPPTSYNKWTSDAVYNYVRHIIPGNEASPSVMTSPQRSGTCGRKSFLSWLKCQLQENNYNRVTHLMKLATLLCFEKSATPQIFIAEVAGKIRRSAKDMKKVGAITEREHQAIKKYLDEVIEKHQEALPSEEKPTVLAELDCSFPAIPKPVNAHANYDLSVNKPPSRHILYDGTGTHFPEELIFHPVNNYTQVAQRLTLLRNHLQTLIRQKRKNDAILVTTLTLGQLPPLSRVVSKKGWDRLKESNKRECIERIHDILEMLHTVTPLTPKNEHAVMLQVSTAWLADLAAVLGMSLYKIGKNRCYLGVSDHTVNHPIYHPFIEPHVREAVVPGPARPLLSNLYTFKSERKRNSETLMRYGNNIKYVFLEPSVFKIDQLMTQLLEKDGGKTDARLRSWKEGAYLTDIFIIKEGEEHLNAFRRIILCQLIALYGLNSVRLDCSVKKAHRERRNSVDHCYIHPISKPTKHLFPDHSLNQSTCYSLNHRLEEVRPDVTEKKEMNGFLMGNMWLKEIKECPDILIDAGQMIGESLSMLCVWNSIEGQNSSQNAQAGITPLEMTLRNRNAAEWIAEIEQVFNEVIQTRSPLWKERVRSLLRITTLINLSIMRQQQQWGDNCKGLETINLEGIRETDFVELNDMYPWPCEVFWLISHQGGTKDAFLRALIVVTREFGSGELYEALHRKIWQEHGKSTEAFFSEGLNVSVDAEEQIDIRTGLVWKKGGRSTALPPMFANINGYEEIKKMIGPPQLVPHEEAQNVWTTRDDTCRFIGGTEHRWCVRGDLLMEQFGKNRWIQPNRYYLAETMDQLTSLFPDSYTSWVCEDRSHALLINTYLNKKLIWKNEECGTVGKLLDIDEELVSLTPRSLAPFQTRWGEFTLPKLAAAKEQVLWMDDEERIVKLTFQEMQLQFDVEWKCGSAFLKSLEYPGYTLVNSDWIPEARGLNCELLRDKNGHEILLIPSLVENKHSQDLLNCPWEFWGSRYFHASRSAEETFTTNSNRKRLFEGSTEALLFIIHGLLRERNYTLAKEYVDLLGRRDWQPSNLATLRPFQNPTPLEHEKSIVLRLRLHLQSNIFNDVLAQQYYSRYHLLPEGWLLSDEEEEKLAKFMPSVIQSEHQKLREENTERTTHFSMPQPRKASNPLIISPERLGTSDQLSIKEMQELILPKNPKNFLYLPLISLMIHPSEEGLLLSAHLLHYGLMGCRKTYAKGSKYLSLMKELLSGRSPRVVKDAENVLSLKKVRIDSKLTVSQRFCVMAQYSIRQYNEVRNSPQFTPFCQAFTRYTPHAEPMDLEVVEPVLTQRQLLMRVPPGKRIGSGFLEAYREVEKRVAEGPPPSIQRKKKRPGARVELVPFARTFLKEWAIATVENTPSIALPRLIQQLKQELDLPVLQQQLKELETHLENEPPADRYEWNEQMMISPKIIEDSIEEENDDRKEDLGKLKREILTFLNEKESYLLSIEDAFAWLSFLEDDPQTAVGLALAEKLETYAELSLWISALYKGKELIEREWENFSPEKLLKVLTSSYKPTGLKGASRWRLAAFSWHYGMQLRKSQGLIYRSLIESGGRYLAKMQTGSGKTAFLTRILIHSTHLGINVVPQQMIGPHMRKLQSEITRFSGVIARRFKCQRGKNENLILRPQRDRKERTCVATTFRDLGSLLLNYYEYLLNAYERLQWQDTKTKGIHGCQTFENPLSEILQEGLGILDEVHLLLDGNHELSFARKSHKGIPEERGEIAALLYEALVEDGLLRFNHMEPVTYNEDIRQILVEKLVRSVYLDLAEHEQPLAKDYLMVERGLEQDEIEAYESFLLELGEKKKNLLQLARAQLEIYLKFTLSRRCGVDYGAVDKALEARPYRGSDMPAPGNSTFALIDTLINFTMQMYIIIGLSADQVTNLIAHWKAAGIEAADVLLRRCLKGTPFENASLRQIATMDNATLKRFKEVIGKSELAAIDYVKSIALPEVIVSKSKLRFTGASLTTLFRRIVGFSATPNNRRGYPLDLRKGLLDFGADLETMEKLMDPQCTRIEVTGRIRPSTFAKKKNTYAVIDPHASLYDWNNEEVAQSILEGAREEIERIAYFNPPTDEWLTIDRSGKINPLKRTKTADHSLFYFIDQGRSFGTDLPLPETGTSLLLIHEGMSYNALHQGAGRCRNWNANGQRLVIVVPRKIVHAWKEASAQNLISWSLQNGGKQLQGVLVSMHRDHMLEVCRSRFLSEMLKLKEPTRQKKVRYTLVHQCINLLEERIPMNQYVEHASLEKQQTDQEIIQDYYDQLNIAYENLLTPDDRNALTRLLESCLSLLPKESGELLESSLALTAENEQEIAVNREQELGLSEYDKDRNWDPQKVYSGWRKKFLSLDPKDCTEKLFEIQKLGIQKLKGIVGNRLFPDQLFISVKALGLRVIWQTKTLLKPEDLPEVQRGNYYRHLPSQSWIYRVVSHVDQIARYILLSDREAHWVAHHMRTKNDSSEKMLKKYQFKGTLISLDGQIVDHLGIGETSEEIVQETKRIRAIVKVFLGSCRDAESLEELGEWLDENPNRIAPLHTYLTLRLAHLRPEHPDHYRFSALGQLVTHKLRLLELPY